jgi:hypothetical protein
LITVAGCATGTTWIPETLIASRGDSARIIGQGVALAAFLQQAMLQEDTTFLDMPQMPGRGNAPPIKRPASRTAVKRTNDFIEGV